MQNARLHDGSVQPYSTHANRTKRALVTVLLLAHTRIGLLRERRGKGIIQMQGSEVHAQAQTEKWERLSDLLSERRKAQKRRRL